VAAHLDFEHLNGAPWVDGDVEVSSMRIRHPGWTHGYKIRVGERSIGYFPDNELVGGKYPLTQKETYQELIGFLDGVDLLFHDAMFSDAEYPRHEGWGHSSFTQAVKLAEEAGVRRLMLFHHAPERTDADLSKILRDLRDDIARRGSRLEIGIAAEGEDLMVGGA
jgi:phosphoribosyl 1,2-cyclic phosphodiesterase